MPGPPLGYGHGPPPLHIPPGPDQEMVQRAKDCRAAGGTWDPVRLVCVMPEIEEPEGGDGGGGGGGGAPGGGYGGPGYPYGIRPVDQGRLEGIGSGTSDLIRDYLENVMSGQDVPYSTEMVTSLRAGAKSAAEGSARSSMDALGYELAKTGMARSPASMRQMTDIRRQSMQDYSAASTNIRQNATVKNYEARMQGLDRTQRWLDNMRRHVLDTTRVGVARDTALAQIQLGYYNIDQMMARLLEDLKFRYAALAQAGELTWQGWAQGYG